MHCHRAVTFLKAMSMDNPLILVIEDEKALRENICAIIAHYGFRVICAPSGEEGIRMTLECLPQLIICDIMLPGIDGFEVFNKIKKQSQPTPAAFIFLTAKSTRNDTRMGMDMGADDYLTKPFTRIELINSIKARLDKLSKIAVHQQNKDAISEAMLNKLSLLSKAERKVLTAISEGFTTPQIAQRLFLSKKTIENHRVNISRKLNLSGPNSLLNFALRLKPQDSGPHLPDNLVSTTPN